MQDSCFAPGLGTMSPNRPELPPAVDRGHFAPFLAGFRACPWLPVEESRFPLSPVLVGVHILMVAPPGEDFEKHIIKP